VAPHREEGAIRLLQPLYTTCNQEQRCNACRYVQGMGNAVQFSGIVEEEEAMLTCGTALFPVTLDYRLFSGSWYAPFVIKDVTKPWAVMKPLLLSNGKTGATWLAVNEASCQLYNRPEHELLGPRTRDIVFADDMESQEVNNKALVGNTRRRVTPGTISSSVITSRMRMRSQEEWVVLDVVGSRQMFYDALGQVSFFILVIEAACRVHL